MLAFTLFLVFQDEKHLKIDLDVRIKMVRFPWLDL